MSSDAFYQDLLTNTVIPLINEYGTAYSVISPVVTDPETLEPSTPETNFVQGLVTDSNYLNGFVGNISDVSGGVKQWKSSQVLILLPDPAVIRNASVSVNGKTHSLTNINELKPANVLVLYTLELEL